MNQRKSPVKNISLRLEALASFCEPVRCIADIGCDHGKLALLLLKQSKAKKVYAVDISAPSLKKAEALAKEKGIEESICCILGDGFLELQQEPIDAAVVAGMGALQIEHILKTLGNLEGKIRYLVLSPNQNADLLRRYLITHRYQIEKETVVLDMEKYYFIMKVVPLLGSDYTEKECCLGRLDYENPIVKQYLADQIRRSDRILKSMAHAKEMDAKKIDENKLLHAQYQKYYGGN